MPSTECAFNATSHPSRSGWALPSRLTWLPLSSPAMQRWQTRARPSARPDSRGSVMDCLVQPPLSTGQRSHLRLRAAHTEAQDEPLSKSKRKLKKDERFTLHPVLIVKLITWCGNSACHATVGTVSFIEGFSLIKKFKSFQNYVRLNKH